MITEEVLKEIEWIKNELKKPIRYPVQRINRYNLKEWLKYYEKLLKESEENKNEKKNY